LFELPEIFNFSEQFNRTLRGKTIQAGFLGNSPHKFVWYNRTQAEFDALTRAKQVGTTRAMGRWLITIIEPGYVLVLGEWGGHILYHPPGSNPPLKYHLILTFTDGSFLSATTQMWGAAELYEQGKELERPYIQGMKPVPLDAGFTYPYLTGLIDTVSEAKKQSVKGLLTQDQSIPGLGNAIAQDIMFRAGLHPRHNIQTLTESERRGLYHAILDTVSDCIQKGGRNDEFDLFNRPGTYKRLMDKNAVGKPCPKCSTPIEKAQYLGGAVYFCPECQK
jgi:formamidopyrimidine-DNA glycosylase